MVGFIESVLLSVLVCVSFCIGVCVFCLLVSTFLSNAATSQQMAAGLMAEHFTSNSQLDVDSLVVLL